MDVPPGNWTLNLVENVEGVTISKSVTLKVLQNPGRPAPKSAVIRVTRS